MGKLSDGTVIFTTCIDKGTHMVVQYLQAIQVRIYSKTTI